MSLIQLQSKLYTDLSTITDLNIYTEPQDANKVNPNFCSVKWLQEIKPQEYSTMENEFIGLELDLYVGIEIDKNDEALKRSANSSLITLCNTIIETAEIKASSINFSNTVVNHKSLIVLGKINGQILL